MINDELIEKVNERLLKRIEEGNEYLLEQIGETLKKIKTLNYKDIHQLSSMLKYGGNYEKIVNKLSKITKMNKKDIYKIFNEVAKHDYNFSKQFYDYRNIKFIPYDENIELKRLVNSVARMTAEQYVNISNTKSIGLGVLDKNKNIVFKALKDAYIQTIDEAILNVSTGRETFDNVLKRSLKEYEKGLKVIYPSTYVGKDGKIHHYTKRLDSALRQQMNDGLRELHNKMQEQIGDEFDSDGVEITVHSYPADDHAEVQGRQFSNEEYAKLQATGIATDYTNKEINIHAVHKDGTYATSHRPISKFNCYHYTFAIILGVNEPQYTDEQLQELIDENEKGFMYNGKHYTMYQGTQLQRQIETAIRDNKNKQIMARASDNKEMIQEAQHNITILNSKYKKLCEASGLYSKADRMRVSGYKRVKVNQASNTQSKTRPDLKYNAPEQQEKIVYKDYTNDILKTKTDDEKLEEISKIANKFNEEYKEAYESMTDDEKFAYNKFTSYYYKDINKHMLGQSIEDSDNYLGLDNVHNTKEYEKEIDKWVDNIENVVNRKKLGENTILYKGTLEKYFDNYKEGDIFTNDIFYSTTLARDIGETFMWNKQNVALLKIKAQKGIPSIFEDFELEITLSKNQKYKFIRAYEEEPITDYFKGKKIKVIEVEAIK